MSWTLHPNYDWICDSVDDATEVAHELIRTVSAHMFYIGISAVPKRRAYGHRRIRVEGIDYPGLANKMYVLMRSESYAAIQDAERDLIMSCQQFDGSRQAGAAAESTDEIYQEYGIVCWNARAGGGGRRPKQGPYGLYILFGG